MTRENDEYILILKTQADYLHRYELQSNGDEEKCVSSRDTVKKPLLSKYFYNGSSKAAGVPENGVIHHGERVKHVHQHVTALLLAKLHIGLEFKSRVRVKSKNNSSLYSMLSLLVLTVFFFSSLLVPYRYYYPATHLYSTNSSAPAYMFSFSSHTGENVLMHPPNMPSKVMRYALYLHSQDSYGSFAVSQYEPSLLWSYSTGYYVCSSPALGDVDRDGKLEVIVSSYDHKVYALNGEDGSLLWSYSTGSDVGSSPALGDVDGDGKLEVIVGSDDNKVYALNGEDGSLLWSYSTGYYVWSSPALGDIDGDGKFEVIVGSDDNKVYALNGEDGSLLWSYSTGSDVGSSPALGDVDGDGKLEVIVGSDDNKVYALDFSQQHNSGFRIYWACFGGTTNHTRNLLNLDPDMDMLSSYTENIIGTNSTNSDTDDDGVPDGWEVNYGLNATNPSDASLDTDSDDLTNLREYQAGTDPTNADTDGDGLSDGWELSNGLSATNSDTDSDGMPDGWEVSYGLNATNATDASQDKDNDGLTNLQEYQAGTDPTNTDTDGDGMSDGWEVSYGFDPQDSNLGLYEKILWSGSCFLGVIIVHLVEITSLCVVAVGASKLRKRRKIERMKRIEELRNKNVRSIVLYLLDDSFLERAVRGTGIDEVTLKHIKEVAQNDIKHSIELLRNLQIRVSPRIVRMGVSRKMELIMDLVAAEPSLRLILCERGLLPLDKLNLLDLPDSELVSFLGNAYQSFVEHSRFEKLPVPQIEEMCISKAIIK
ncbi:MAG: PQQ-binding-like beta-propeller repeat protein, partial [Candidatus Odinarchaeota archaeon]|nr:PQQ-binding-like beta-propeller repeat protein [Candidatus Odinarchaeota archaeon]